MFRPSRATFAILGCLTLAFAVGLPVVRAQDHPAGDSLRARVQALVKMTPEARRAELKKMSREERRSLWFELKRERRAVKGLKPLAKGSGLTPRPIVRGPNAAPRLGKVSAKAGVLGTIQYDDGVPTVNFGGGAIIGNRFNTATGNPIATSGTISTVVAVVMPGAAVTSSSAGFVIEGPQTGGGGAMALFSTFTGGLTASTETVTFSGLGVNYTGASFFVLFGDFASSFIPAFGTGTTQGQGHHGVVGYTGGMGPNITGTFNFGGTLNGLVRVTGNVLPVELMSFDVQ